MTEREWREASDMRASTVNLAIVMAVAAALRFWALGAGIPDAVSGDETVLLDRLLGMIRAGDFNPRFFSYGGLIFYVHLPVVVVQFLFGAIAGRWGALDQVRPADFYFGARVLTALLGTATVYLLFQIGQRWGSRHALLGAGLLAVMPVHVAQSHYALPDVPATFFVTLTMLYSLVAHERATVRTFMWAGGAAGLAAATMYGTAVALAIPLVTVWMTLHATPSRLRCALAVVGAALGTFLVAAPYSVLDLPAFLNGVAALAQSYRAAGASQGPAWFEALVQLRLTLGWPASLMLAAGYVLGVVRAIEGPGRVRWTVVVAFSVLYLVMLATRSTVIDRDVLPLLPFSGLLAAVAVVSGVSLLRRFDIPRAPRRALIAALTIAALLPPLVLSISYDRQLSTHPAKALDPR